MVPSLLLQGRRASLSTGTQGSLTAPPLPEASQSTGGDTHQACGKESRFQQLNQHQGSLQSGNSCKQTANPCTFDSPGVLQGSVSAPFTAPQP